MIKNRTYKLVFIALGTAMAMLFSYIESLIIIPIPVPGIRLGLANVVSVIFLYFMSEREAVLVGLVRILLSALLFGNLFSLLFSLMGFGLSMFSMIFLKKTGKFTVLGVSMSGGLFHNIGQIMIALVITGTIGIVNVLPAMAIAGMVTGLFNGMISSILIGRIKQYDRLFKG